MPLQLLTVEKAPQLARRIRSIFADEQAEVEWVRLVDNVVEKADRKPYDILVIADEVVDGGEMTASELMGVVGEKSPRTRVVFFGSKPKFRSVHGALREGTCEFVDGTATDLELRMRLETAYAAVAAASSGMPAAKGLGYQDLVGRSRPMQDVYRQIRQAAATDIPVLVTGETGTGKDLVAQAIHDGSARRDRPFVPVHLGALPPELIASDLFGHEKGAFTGALEARPGKFEQAQDGTVFLDEIGTIDQKVQVSLLRLLEQQKYQRLGGRKTYTSKARVIAATNEDLAAAVEEGRFREDLYFRLDVFLIDLPPLRERRGDVALLVDEFLKRYNTSFKKNVVGIAPECVSLLESYPWPGNVRELKNVVQRAVLVCTGEVLLPRHLPPRFQPDQANRPTVTFEVGTPLAQIEKEMVKQCLAATRNNRKRAADLLGISRRALYNKLAKYGIA